MQKQIAFFLFLMMMLGYGFSSCGTEPSTSEQNAKEQVSTTDTSTTETSGIVDSGNPVDESIAVDTVTSKDESQPQDTSNTQDTSTTLDTDTSGEQGVQIDQDPVVPEALAEAPKPDNGGGPTRKPLFQKGGDVLFIGHSFFVPPSRGYNEIATHADHKGSFPNHFYASEFAGGEKGAPGALWKDATRKKNILKKLSTGKVQLLAMTAHLSNSDQKDYQNWIDVALKENRATKFLISCPWPTGGSGAKASDFQQQNELLADRLFQIVVALRKANPGTEIHFLNHGRVAVVTKNRFENGNLKSTKQKCCSTDGVFRDTFGHGGDIIEKTAGLFFLTYLTGFNSLSPKVFPKLDAKEMQSIVNEVLQYNRSRGYFPK